MEHDELMWDISGGASLLGCSKCSLHQKTSDSKDSVFMSRHFFREQDVSIGAAEQVSLDASVTRFRAEHVRKYVTEKA